MCIVILYAALFRDLLNLSRNLWEHRIPFIYCLSIGFIGWIRVQLNEHAIIESHPENVKHDLRLDAPFAELLTYMDTVRVAVEPGDEGTEILKQPWLVVLFKAIQKYINDQQIGNSCIQNGNKNGPKTHPCRMKSSEKSQFKEYLRSCTYFLLNYILLDRRKVTAHVHIFYQFWRAWNFPRTSSCLRKQWRLFTWLSLQQTSHRMLRGFLKTQKHKPFLRLVQIMLNRFKWISTVLAQLD